eukprot:9493713-Pyramimonas_sp.AAC.1
MPERISNKTGGGFGLIGKVEALTEARVTQHAAADSTVRLKRWRQPWHLFSQHSSFLVPAH